MRYLISIASIISCIGTVFAAPVDVPSDSWYSTTVSEFGRAGYFDETQPFRPIEKATRAEFVQLVVKLQGGVKHAPFTTQSFDDVSPNNPFFNYFEEAGLAGWLKGTNNCYGKHPCSVNPNSPINRAEAAILMMRAFNLQMREKAPAFNDNPTGLWFTVPINSAASLCVLQGDAGGKNVRPADSMIRAEMVTMLERALQNLNYPNCNPTANFSLPKLNLKQTSNAVNQLNTQSQASQQTLSSTSSSSSSISNSAISCTGDYFQCKIRPKQLSNINYWKTLHEKLVEKAKVLAAQPKGAGCIGPLDQVEGKLLSGLSQYTLFYNMNSVYWLERMENIEADMLGVEGAIESTPTICY